MSNTPLIADISAYPQANIDPREKSYEWVLQYTRAAYNDSRGFMPFGTLNVGNYKFSEIMAYALGKQPVDKYKKMKNPGSPKDGSWAAIDWTVPAFMCKFREIGISKILQRKFDIQAFAVDPLAKSEEDEFFNKMKVKIMMKEAAEQAGSDLANSPELQVQAGEPQDLEQLQMMQQFGYKHVMAMEAENAVNLIHQQNDFEEKRKQVATNLYDFGIGAYTQWIDENGMVREKNISPEYLGLSYCEKPDFSDLVHWYEIVPTYIADIAPYYTRAQLDDICKKVVGKNGNPTQYTPFNGMFNRSWNRFKVYVIKIRFLSWNESVYKEEVDSRNNIRFGKTKYENKKFVSVNGKGELEGYNDDELPKNYNEPLDDCSQGQPTPKFMSEVKKVVYKASWILDTEYMHDWGLQENQNRKLSSWWDTDLGIQVYSWNFYKMQFGGITERLIPLEDKACMAWFNLQNLANNLVPYLINIDLNSVESVNMGGGGEKMKPSEIINFIFSKFVVPWRSTDLINKNPNYKPVSIEATGQLAAFGQLYEELQHTIEMMRQISGLNELTDGSTPNAKTLVPVAESAIQSTNNALYLLSEADRWLIEREADAVVQQVQIAVKLGKIEGYAKALGSTSVKFFQINPDISLHELGIFLRDVPTQAQREALWQEVSAKESMGLLTVADKIYVMSCQNLTEAGMVLDYKIQKRKEEAHQQQLQIVQQQSESNAQVAQVTEQMKQQTIQMQGQIDMQLLLVEKQLEYKIEEMKKSMDLQGETVQAEGRLNVGSIAAEAKVIAQQIASQASHQGKQIDAMTHLTGKAIDGENAIEKQKEANKKPQPKKSA